MTIQTRDDRPNEFLMAFEDGETGIWAAVREKGIPKYTEFPLGTPMRTILKDLGLFTSGSEAQKNGWDRPIPEGVSTLTIGKLKNQVEFVKMS